MGVIEPSVDGEGFAFVREVARAEERRYLLELLGVVTGAGNRGWLAQEEIGGLARSQRWLDLLRPYLPAEPRPVRAIYFDKAPAAEWLVPWHQDLSMAVRERVKTSGFGR